MAENKKVREIEKRGYELGGGDGPTLDNLPPVQDNGPGAGANPQDPPAKVPSQ